MVATYEVVNSRVAILYLDDFPGQKQDEQWLQATQ